MKAEELNVLSNFSEIAIRRLEERGFKKIKVRGSSASTGLALFYCCLAARTADPF